VRILAAGSTGFLGAHLVRHLRQQGHDVVRLVRRQPRHIDELRWDPSRPELDPTVLSTVDAVVNLAGAPVFRLWTTAYRHTLRSSRVLATSSLATALAGEANRTGRPLTLINASAVGYYGDTGDRAVDETSPPGQGFLAEVCREWEAATAPAADAGVRVVRLRTGLPLHPANDQFRPMLLQFRLFAGGRLGSGRQYVPWISLADWVGAVTLLLTRTDVAGPANLTGPAPVTNAEFGRTLAGILHRPVLLPVPAFALRLVLDGFGAEALVSSRVLPRALTGAGYEFQHPDADSALRWAVAQRPGTDGVPRR
jgi:uncharacterized protein (TIGR01777 family)